MWFDTRHRSKGIRYDVAEQLVSMRACASIADLHRIVPQLRRTRTEAWVVYLYLPWWFLLSQRKRWALRGVLDLVMPAGVHARFRPTLW